MKIKSIIYLIILSQFIALSSFASSNKNDIKIEAIFQFHKQKKLSYWAYYQNKDDFIIELMNNETQSPEYYLYDNKSVKLIDKKTFIKMNAKKINLPDRELETKLESENKELGKYLSGAINFKGDKYIVSIEKHYWKEKLYIYDENDNKLAKLKMADNMYAVVGYGETFMFYDDISDTVYFSGYKQDKKTLKAVDIGLYGYNFKTEKCFIIDKIHKGNFPFICPYRIPNTNLLIFLNLNGLHLVTEILVANIGNEKETGSPITNPGGRKSGHP